MFRYSDPTGTGLLEAQGAIDEYRIMVNRFYQQGDAISDSAFATLDAFELADSGAVNRAAVPWTAYPLSRASFSDETIDRRRALLQDEYVEWRVEREGVRVARITFCSQFPEYYEALAMVGSAALAAAVAEAYPGANPTERELFGVAGVDAMSPRDRVDQYHRHTVLENANPWNNGEKGILHLVQPANTMGALFVLVFRCAVVRLGVPLSATCGGNFCVPNRSSDPRVCTAAQEAARAGRAITLADPVGIVISRLGGDWERGGRAVDPNEGSGLWTVSQNGRRAVLEVPDDLTLDGDPIVTGAQVARVLTVEARVLVADDAALPAAVRFATASLRGQ